MSADKKLTPEQHWGFEDDPAEGKEVDTKQEVKKISSLINALVVFVSLSKNAGKYDKGNPCLPVIQTEAQQAKEKAVNIMKDLLQSWES